MTGFAVLEADYFGAITTFILSFRILGGVLLTGPITQTDIGSGTPTGQRA
jgi:hypothetical protein